MVQAVSAPNSCRPAPQRKSNRPSLSILPLFEPITQPPRPSPQAISRSYEGVPDRGYAGVRASLDIPPRRRTATRRECWGCAVSEKPFFDGVIIGVEKARRVTAASSCAANKPLFAALLCSAGGGTRIHTRRLPSPDSLSPLRSAGWCGMVR